MPGIVDDLIAPELARMISHHLVVEQDHDAFGSARPRCKAETPQAFERSPLAVRGLRRMLTVPEYLHKTFQECAEPHELLTASLCRDLLGRAVA